MGTYDCQVIVQRLVQCQTLCLIWCLKYLFSRHFHFLLPQDQEDCFSWLIWWNHSQIIDVAMVLSRCRYWMRDCFLGSNPGHHPQIKCTLGLSLVIMVSVQSVAVKTRQPHSVRTILLGFIHYRHHHDLHGSRSHCLPPSCLSIGLPCLAAILIVATMTCHRPWIVARDGLLWPS